jgi:hypothetical protein
LGEAEPDDEADGWGVEELLCEVAGEVDSDAKLSVSESYRILITP